MLPAEGIPLTIVMPPTLAVRFVDMPFTGEDVIGGDRRRQLPEPIESGLQGAAGVDCPDPPSGGDLLKFPRQGGNARPPVRIGTREGPVKIGTKQSDHRITLPRAENVGNPQFVASRSLLSDTV